MQQHSEMGSQPKKKENATKNAVDIQNKIIYKVIIHHIIYLFSINTKHGGWITPHIYVCISQSNVYAAGQKQKQQ